MARLRWRKSRRCIFARRCARRACLNQSASRGVRTNHPVVEMKVSVIIPALNEARELPETIARARGAAEIIVADGGSSDGTQEVCGARVINALRGRARQMNAGAAIAAGDVLLFLHADTWLQAGWLEAITAALSDSGVPGGGFERQFRTDSVFLKTTCALAAFRNRAIGWHL